MNPGVLAGLIGAFCALAFAAWIDMPWYHKAAIGLIISILTLGVILLLPKE